MSPESHEGESVPVERKVEGRDDAKPEVDAGTGKDQDEPKVIALKPRLVRESEDINADLQRLSVILNSDRQPEEPQ